MILTGVKIDIKVLDNTAKVFNKLGISFAELQILWNSEQITNECLTAIKCRPVKRF